ncbi:MAG: hypothetical protein HDR72_01765 [Ruminococcaceae bacterium]|nr:hypothetical protein [Oscillospiraceae bacterium]
MNKYKFSLIIDAGRCENTACAVTSTINNIESQGISFKNDVQVFLIMPRNELTEHICEMYKIIYPRNCKTIFSIDSGKTIAECIKDAAGSYLCIIEAGSVFSANALKEAYDYFEFAKGNIDVVGMQVILDDKAYKIYNNNFKKSKRNIHLLQDVKAAPCDLNGLFIKSSVAKDKLRDKDILNTDAFLLEVISRRNTLGVLESAFSIRIAPQKERVIAVSEFKDIISEMLLNAEKMFGSRGFIPLYAQYFFAVKTVDLLNLSEDIMGVYHHPQYDNSDMWSVFGQLMKYIDDKIIMSLTTTRFNKIFLLTNKYGRFCDFDKYSDDIFLNYENTNTYALSSFPARIELMSISDGCLVIEGLLHLPCCLDMGDLKIKANINGKLTELEQVERYSDRYYYEKTFLYEKGFKLVLPLTDAYYNIRIVSEFGNAVCYNKAYEFMDICSISSDVKADYYYNDGYAVTLGDSCFECRKCGEEERAVYERSLQSEIVELEPERAAEIIAIRDFYWENRGKKDKQIWLITDRPDRADDNAEAFFRYMADRAEEDIDLYFILSSSSSAYKELCSVGKVIEPFSAEHLKLQTIADYVISSQMGEAEYNPFNEDVKYVRGLFMRPKFVFLQHGVINNDHGKVMGKYGRNFTGFVTSAKGEYDYMLEPKFHYTEQQVWLTGLPRWDLLYRNPKKIITIMPTWRMFLTTRVFDEESQTKIWKPNDDFIESDYFNFYNDLINNNELLDAADKYGYKICFMPHVMFLKLAGNFHSDGRAVIVEYEKRYREIYAESALIVTDYSSAVFDFAYMRQPILYCQFDKEEFYRGHSYKKGYFDHERDGFGEVAYNLDDTVRLIIEYMSNDCKLKPKYKERIDNFFEFDDRDCCKRVYEHIRTIEADHANSDL